MLIKSLAKNFNYQLSDIYQDFGRFIIFVTVSRVEFKISRFSPLEASGSY